MGRVYLALDSNLSGKKVAIKELTVDFRRPEDRTSALRQFRMEAALLSPLEHPRLVPVTDFFEEGDNAYLVMSYVDGKTLVSAMYDAGRTMAEVVGWIDQIAEALEYLHERDTPILFRDLKPGNVMLDHRGQIRLIDFGIARTFEVGQSTSTFLKGAGTAEFAPVEQFGAKGTDTRADIYALGATMFNLLTGDLPPVSVDVVAGESAPPNPRALNPGIPPALEAVILKAMALRKEDRYPTVRALRAALAAVPAAALQRPAHGGPPRPLMPQSAPTVPPTDASQTASGDSDNGETQPLPSPHGDTLVGGPPRAAAAGTEPAWQTPAPPHWETDPYFREPASRTASPARRVVVTVVALVLVALLGAGLWTRYASAGWLAISSTPDGAQVWLDGAQQSGTTPLVLEIRGRGVHTLTVEKEGVEPQTVTFSMANGQAQVRQGFEGQLDTRLPSRPRLVLSLSPKKGTLVVHPTPPGRASLFIDGKRVQERTPEGFQIALPIGRHVVRMQTPGLAAFEQEVEIAHRDRVEVRPTLAPLAASTGSLSVTSRPEGGRVRVDGGASAPVPTVLSLTPGVHVVRVEKSGYETLETSVSIQKGEKQTLIAPLVAKAAPPSPTAERPIIDVPAPVVIHDNGSVNVPRPAATPPPYASSVESGRVPRRGRFPVKPDTTYVPPRVAEGAAPVPPRFARDARAPDFDLCAKALTMTRSGNQYKVSELIKTNLQARGLPDSDRRLAAANDLLTKVYMMPEMTFQYHRDNIARDLERILADP